MILEAISDVGMYFLHKFLPLLVFFTGSCCDFYQSFDNRTEKVKEVNVVHGEDGVSLLSVRIGSKSWWWYDVSS